MNGKLPCTLFCWFTVASFNFMLDQSSKSRNNWLRIKKTIRVKPSNSPGVFVVETVCKLSRPQTLGHFQVPPLSSFILLRACSARKPNRPSGRVIISSCAIRKSVPEVAFHWSGSYVAQLNSGGQGGTYVIRCCTVNAGGRLPGKKVWAEGSRKGRFCSCDRWGHCMLRMTGVRTVTLLPIKVRTTGKLVKLCAVKMEKTNYILKVFPRT